MNEKPARKPALSLRTATSWLFTGQLLERGIVRPVAAPAAVEALELVEAQISSGGQKHIQDGRSSDPQNEFSDEYEILETIGEGAVCNVYRVKNKGLNCEFALKVLKKELSNIGVAVRQFKKEVDAAADLTHANIAAVYGHGQTADGAPFVVTHLCKGKNLAQAVREDGPFKFERAVGVFMQICDAMSHAHLKSVIHRDLKPSNVVLSVDENGAETARVIDFGLATVLQSARSAVTDVTRTGEVFGSPHYMSPEQCRGDKVDERSDIYSFGCLMYEVVNGNPPFSGLNLVQVIMRQLQEPAPEFDELIPKSAQMKQLQAVVLRCLEKDPLKRFQHFDQVKLELERILSGKGSTVAESDPQAPWYARALAATADGLFIGMIIFNLSLCIHYNFASFASTGFLNLCEGILFWSPEWNASYLWSGSFVHLGAVNDLYALFYLAVGLLYHVFFESSKLQATPGKLLLGLKVVDGRGERISAPRSGLRAFSKVMEVPLAVFELCCTRRIRSIQSRFSRPAMDSWSKTYVVRKRSITGFALSGPRGYFCAEKLSLEKVHQNLKNTNRWLVCSLVLMVLFCISLFSRNSTIIDPASEALFNIIFWCPWLCAPIPYYFALKARKEILLRNRQIADGKAKSWWTGLLRDNLNGKTKP